MPSGIAYVKNLAVQQGKNPVKQDIQIVLPKLYCDIRKIWLTSFSFPEAPYFTKKNFLHHLKSEVFCFEPDINQRPGSCLRNNTMYL